MYAQVVGWLVVLCRDIWRKDMRRQAVFYVEMYGARLCALREHALGKRIKRSHYHIFHFDRKRRRLQVFLKHDALVGMALIADQNAM